MTQPRELTKEERKLLNLKIGELLGFEVYEVKGWGWAVSYPGDWRDFQYCAPQNCVPDFLMMLEEYRSFVNRHGIVPQSELPTQATKEKASTGR